MFNILPNEILLLIYSFTNFDVKIREISKTIKNSYHDLLKYNQIKYDNVIKKIL